MSREPEWDDEQRESMLGLLLYERGVCQGCGFHRDVASNKANHFTFEDHYCPVCKGAAQWGRVQGAQDKQQEDRLGERPNPMTVRPGDGRTTTIRRLSPLEIENRPQRSAKT